jgi:hypothetical protein
MSSSLVYIGPIPVYHSNKKETKLAVNIKGRGVIAPLLI